MIMLLWYSGYSMFAWMLRNTPLTPAQLVRRFCWSHCYEGQAMSERSFVMAQADNAAVGDAIGHCQVRH